MTKNDQGLVPKLQELLCHVRKSGIAQADLSVANETGFSVSARMGDVETLEHHQSTDVTLTLYDQQRTASASASELSESGLLALFEKARSMIRFVDVDPYSGLPNPEDMATDYPLLNLSHPWPLTPAEAIEKALLCDDLARSQDVRIAQCKSATVSTYAREDYYLNTHDFVGVYPSTYHAMSCGVVAKDPQGMERDSEFTCARDPLQLKTSAWLAEQAAKKSIARLSARRLSTRECPVLFAPEVAKSVIAHLLGALRGSALYRGLSFLKDSLGQSCFSPNLTLYQRPHLDSGYASAPFDEQGVRTQDNTFIDAGCVKSYILDAYSARRLDLQATGNAGGAFNLFVQPGDDDFSALLSKMDTGFLVTELMGQGVDLLTGTYSRGASGFWVSNGKIQHPVHEMTIAGNLKEMMTSLSAVGADVDMRTNIKTGSLLVPVMTISGT